MCGAAAMIRSGAISPSAARNPLTNALAIFPAPSNPTVETDVAIPQINAQVALFVLLLFARFILKIYKHGEHVVDKPPRNTMTFVSR